MKRKQKVMKPVKAWAIVLSDDVIRCKLLFPTRAEARRNVCSGFFGGPRIARVVITEDKP